jgi:uncharacterized cupredoxin-like copper-binding protein
VGLALLTFVMVAAGESRGQDLEILDRGKPVAGVSVSAGGQVVGTTDSTGQISFNPNLLNVTKGETVEVWLKDCGDGRVEIVLAREGEDDPCVEEGAEVGERCGCRRIGAFVVGDGPATIDIGTGNVTQAEPGGAALAPGEDHSFADLQIGAMFDWSSFYQLEDTVCGRPGVVSCDTDNGVPGVGGYLDYRFGRSNFGLSLEAHYAKLDAESTTEDGTRTSFDVNSWQFQAAGVYNVPLSPRAGWYIRSGYAVMYNEGDAASDSESESRSETGSRLLLGSGLHWPIGERWCARTGVDWTTGFDSDDADTNARWSFAVGYRMDRN